MAQLDTQQSGAAVRPPQGTWVIDLVHSSIEFSVRHLVAAKVRGHISRFTGRIDVTDPPEDSTISAEVVAASIDTRSPERDIHLRSAGLHRPRGVRPHLEPGAGDRRPGRGQEDEVAIDVQAVRA